MNKPQPVVNEVNAPFWNALSEQRIVLQTCGGCRKTVFYPRVCCPYCQSDSLEWGEVSGHGRVVSHTTIHRPHHPGFDDEVPYVFGAIELTEGALIYGQILDAPITDVSLLGQAVEPVFQPSGQGQTLLAFRLAETR